MSIAIIVAICVFGLSFFLSLRKPMVGVTMCIVLLPWAGLSVDPGVRLPAYRLSLFGWIGAVTVRRLTAGTPVDNRYSRIASISIWGLAFLVWAVGWTTAQMFFIPEAGVTGSVFRAVPELRSVGQIVWLLLRLAPLLLLPLVLARLEQVIAVIRFYLASLLLLALLGCVQVGVWMSTGVDILPIGVVANLFSGGGGVRHGMFDVFGIPLLRMSSLGGEPKVLGQSLAVGLLIIQAVMFLSEENVQRVGTLWILFFLCMLATVSTSALYVWAGGTILLVAYLVVARPLGRTTVSLYMLGLILLCLLGLGASISISGLDISQFGEVLAARTIERRIIPDFDLAILGFLRDHPGWGIVGVGLGNIHLYANEYIPEFARYYMESSIFVGKSGYLRLLSEVGLLGLALYIIWMWREIVGFQRVSTRRVLNGRKYQMNGRVYRAIQKVIIGVVAVVVVAFLARGYLWEEAVWSVAMVRSLRMGVGT